MRLSAWCAMGLSLFAWWSAPAPAAACSCAPSDFDGHYVRADHVLHAKVLRFTAAASGRERVYTVALLERDFKGCLSAGSEVQVATSPSTAGCGVPLELGAEVLLFANWEGRPPEATLHISLCGGSGPFARFTDAQRDALRAKPVQCGDASSCANGEQVVQCFVDPCAVSRCDVAGATCQANYCGGCNAQWYDARGTRVCVPAAPACDDDAKDRRYFAKSRETCKQVRFACGAAEQMFIDECGCGCVTSLAPN